MSEADRAAPAGVGMSEVEPALARELARHMSEEIVAVDRGGRITALLGGPAGSIGQSGLGTSIFDHCHPDDLPEMVRFALDGLGSAPGWEGVACVRLRVRTGDWRYHEIHVMNKLDDPVVGGFVLRLREIDVARPDLAAPGAALLEHELETLASAVPLPILFLDRLARAYFVNDAARDLCSHLLAPLGAEGLAGIADIRDRALLEDTLASLVADGGERTVTFRLLPVHPAAEERVVEATFSAQGGTSVHSIVVTLVDISAHHARESELRRMASRDPLTGLLNRAEIEDALAQRLRSAPERVALLYCDLDGFKSVNDNHGHDVGDELLVEIARILETKTRPTDLVGRLGGDEFAVLLDSPDPSEAHSLACRIAVAIAELSSYRRLPVSASVGAATARRGDTT
ncbi:MAG: diguanylate cyclase/phosphodiesterase with sensor(s), partial [Acidimicrobiaceae bacterium]|nr:diguanylate cyclase/phosphodiesterase with sensor(s) [Acidimicrobiaceae bacterium]